MRQQRGFKLFVLAALFSLCEASHKCGVREAGSKGLKYVMGDALVDKEGCIGPNGEQYPSHMVERMLPALTGLQGFFSSKRQGRTFFSQDHLESPLSVQQKLMKARLDDAKSLKGIQETLEHERLTRKRRQADATTPITTSAPTTSASVESNSTMAASVMSEAAEENGKPITCPSTTPSRLCKTKFNTTAPLYGVSLTTGKVVTIVQKFPDLLQQVIFETCEKSQCDVIHGECVQTYIPYLFLVIPLGPVTLTGQDYVMVESGCTCRPKYAPESETGPNPIDALPNFQT